MTITTETLHRLLQLFCRHCCQILHYSDIIMGVMASQIICVSMVYLIVCPGAVQRKHQSSASLAFVWGIRRWPVNFPHKGPLTPKVFPFDDVIMYNRDMYYTVYYSCSALKNYIRSIQMFKDPLFLIKLHILSTILLNGALKSIE